MGKRKKNYKPRYPKRKKKLSLRQKILLGSLGILGLAMITSIIGNVSDNVRISSITMPLFFIGITILAGIGAVYFTRFMKQLVND